MNKLVRILALALTVSGAFSTTSCDDKKSDPQAQPVQTATLSGHISPAGAITTVTATDASGKTTTATPGSTGAYSFLDLALATYTLTFAPAMGYIAPPAATATLVAGGTTAPTTTVAALVVKATLNGQVAPAGAVLQVTATDASGTATTATPSSMGAYSFPALPVGAYTLRFTPTSSYLAPAPVATTLAAAGTTVPTVTLTTAPPSATFNVNGVPTPTVYIFSITNAGQTSLRFSASINGTPGPTVHLDLDWLTPILGTFTLDQLGYTASYTGRDYISYYTGVYYSGSPYSGTVTITSTDSVLRRFSGTFTFVAGNPTISTPSGTLPPGTPPSVAVNGTFSNFNY